MAIFGGGQQTAQITTGNVRTTFDLWTATGPGVVNNNLKNPLGLVYYDVGQGGLVNNPGSSLPNNLGAPSVYKYVLYKSTTNPALVANPGLVFWTDETFTTVSGASGDGFTGTEMDAAGFLMPNTTDLPNLTATILNNGGNGSGVWICVGGLLKGGNIGATSVAKADMLYGGSGNWAIADLAHGGASSVVKIMAQALAAGASNKVDMVVLPLNIT